MTGGVLSGLDNRPGKVIASAAIQRIKKKMPGKPHVLGIKTAMTISDTRAHALPLVRGRGREITAED